MASVLDSKNADVAFGISALGDSALGYYFIDVEFEWTLAMGALHPYGGIVVGIKLVVIKGWVWKARPALLGVALDKSISRAFFQGFVKLLVRWRNLALYVSGDINSFVVGTLDRFWKRGLFLNRTHRLSQSHFDGRDL